MRKPPTWRWRTKAGISSSSRRRRKAGIPGLYRVDIFVGYEANDVTRMGTLRFTVMPKA